MKVLLVDDNHADVRLIRESFRVLRIRHDLEIANSGDEAMKLLKGREPPAQLPDIILLDINMPGMDGFDLLRAIRRDLKLQITPVIVLSSSANEGDIQRAYSLGANAYMSKPMDDFLALVDDFDRFWLKRARLPKTQEG